MNFQEAIKDTLWIGFDKANQKIGIVFKVSPSGYGGPIPILVGLGADLTIKKIYIGSASEGLKETPGLGAQIQNAKFKDQFCNRTYSEIKLIKDGGKIQAITGATISSNAVVTGIRQGIEKYKHFLQTDSIKPLPTESQYDTTFSKLKELLPGTVSFQEIIKDTVWLGKNDNNQVVGMVFRVAPMGYNDLIPILVGYGIDQEIKKIYIGSADEGLKETPGLGDKITEETFCNQFTNKMLSDLKLTKYGGKIQAISGATISSVAVINGIRNGIERFQQYLKNDSIRR